MEYALAIIAVMILRNALWLFLLTVFLWLGRKFMSDRAGRLLFGHYWSRNTQGRAKYPTKDR